LTPTPFNAQWDYRVFDGSGADGISFNYGPMTSADGGEWGMVGAGLTVSFIEWQPYERVELRYNGNIINSAAFTLTGNMYRHVVVNIDSVNFVTVSLGGSNVISTSLANTDYSLRDKTGWRFGFAGRTGARTNKHSIKNLVISRDEGCITGEAGAVFTTLTGTLAGGNTVPHATFNGNPISGSKGISASSNECYIAACQALCTSTTACNGIAVYWGWCNMFSVADTYTSSSQYSQGMTLALQVVKSRFSTVSQAPSMSHSPSLNPSVNQSPNSPSQLVRKIRVKLEGRNYLHMKEVQVYDTSGVNRALNKLASQSSTYTQHYWGSDPASKAVNGVLYDYSHTNNDAGMYHELTYSNLIVYTIMSF
jgi:hypothetical protein